MFSKSFFTAFVLLALSGLTAHAAPHPSGEDCSSSVSVVVQTVTLSNRTPEPTPIDNRGGSKAAGATSSKGSGKQTSSATKGASGGVGSKSGSNSKSNSKSSSNSGSGSNKSASSTTTSAGSGESASLSTTTTATSTTTTTADNSGSDSAAGSGSTNDGNPQTSLQLDPSVICEGFEDDGQNAADDPEPGQTASDTSPNNFINNCANFPDLPLTNGKQITTGSCNPAPLGVIPSVENMPSQKFQSPQNFGTIPANQDFPISLKIVNLQSGAFTNAKTNYFAAPQKLNSAGLIIGHTHIVMEVLDSITSTTPTNPGTFIFFQGVNQAADANGIVTVNVTKGVPPGAYRICSIGTSANHVPFIGPIAQHGTFDDCIYCTAVDGSGDDNTATASTAAATSGSTSSAAGGNNNQESSPAVASKSSAAGGNNNQESSAPATAVASKSSAAGKGSSKSSTSTAATASKSTSSQTGKSSNQNNNSQTQKGSKFGGGKFGRK